MLHSKRDVKSAKGSSNKPVDATTNDYTCNERMAWIKNINVKNRRHYPRHTGGGNRKLEYSDISVNVPLEREAAQQPRPDPRTNANNDHRPVSRTIKKNRPQNLPKMPTIDDDKIYGEGMANIPLESGSIWQTYFERRAPAEDDTIRTIVSCIASTPIKSKGDESETHAETIVDSKHTVDIRFRHVADTFALHEKREKKNQNNVAEETVVDLYDTENETAAEVTVVNLCTAENTVNSSGENTTNASTTHLMQKASDKLQDLMRKPEVHEINTELKALNIDDALKPVQKKNNCVMTMNNCDTDADDLAKNYFSDGKMWNRNAAGISSMFEKLCALEAGKNSMQHICDTLVQMNGECNEDLLKLCIEKWHLLENNVEKGLVKMMMRFPDFGYDCYVIFGLHSDMTSIPATKSYYQKVINCLLNVDANMMLTDVVNILFPKMDYKLFERSFYAVLFDKLENLVARTAIASISKLSDKLVFDKNNRRDLRNKISVNNWPEVIKAVQSIAATEDESTRNV